MRQLNLFPEHRATEKQAIAITIDSLKDYAQHYKHWQISFSGGKDSTALVTLILHLIETKEIKAPLTLTVMYADTRMELPPLHASAMQILAEVERRGFKSQVVMAELDKRFMVYLLGRGVPPPNNSTLRWCTRQIKLEPMKVAMQKLYDEHGEKILSFNGVRIGESAIRDRRIEQRMAISCSKNGSECGQGWFQRELPDSICDKFSPLLHWRVCNIWDWLMLDAPRLGFDTELLAMVYGGDEAVEMNARTGCICCPLASKDTALEYLVSLPDWSYLKPLLKLRSLYEWAREYQNRLQKVGEKKKDGFYTSSPNRKGPLTLSARQELLDKILAVRDEVNEVRGDRIAIDLINSQERSRIEELIAAKTYPNRWSGDEPVGNEIVPQYDSEGNVQRSLF
jgi:DNA sulfur modification protein DndC